MHLPKLKEESQDGETRRNSTEKKRKKQKKKGSEAAKKKWRSAGKHLKKGAHVRKRMSFRKTGTHHVLHSVKKKKEKHQKQHCNGQFFFSCILLSWLSQFFSPFLPFFRVVFCLFCVLLLILLFFLIPIIFP